MSVTYEDIEKWNLDDEKSPLEHFSSEIDIDEMPHKTSFTVSAESCGRVWESQWLIPKDISEVEWVEIQRMLKLAMTTLCRLPIDEALGVVDPEGYKKMLKVKEEREQAERKRLSAVPGEEGYEFKDE